MKMRGKVFCLRISTIMGTHFKISTAMTIKQISFFFFPSEFSVFLLSRYSYIAERNACTTTQI